MYEHYNSGDNADRDIYGPNWSGQTFTSELTHLISKVKLKFFRVGDPGTINVSIKNTSASKPTGADLCSGIIEGTDITLSADGEWYEITLGSGAELTKNTKYAIVVRAPSGDVSNKLSWRTDASTPTYAYGTYCGSSDSGIDWSTYSGSDAMFEEWGTGPPSPTTVTWGNLLKSQISAEKIEAAILRMIQNHEDDADAHLEIGESLQSHKASVIIDHIAGSVVSDKIEDDAILERHRYSISALQRLISMFPELAAKMAKKVWTGIAGDEGPYDFSFDYEYMYVALMTVPAKVVKINLSTMATVATWTGANGEDRCKSLFLVDSYLYAGLFTVPAKVVKIDPATMETVDSWTGAAGEDRCGAIIFDGTYLYVGTYTAPAKVLQINLSTMATVATWTGGAFEDLCFAFTFDGIYLYAGLAIDRAKVMKIDTSDMTTVTYWEGGAGDTNCISLAFDGSYIYAGLNRSPTKVIKINPSTMATADTWEGAAGQNACYGLIFDGYALYAALYTTPAQIIMINQFDMTKISVWTGADGENLCMSFGFDGLFLYAGIATVPAKVIRKIIRGIDETGT